MKKKVLLCAPFTAGDLFVGRWVTPHYGLWRLSSFINANGHYCKIYDCNDPKKEKFEDILKEELWDIIGFSILTATEEYDIEKMFIAKEECSNALILSGGSGAALKYQFILDNTPAEIVLLAEGEYSLLDICNGKSYQDIQGIVFKKKAKIFTNEDYWEITKQLDIKNMEVNRFWDKTASLYETPDYNEINTFRLFTSNYCFRGCKFCTLTLWRKYASGKNCPLVGLTSQQIIEMIKKVLKEYPECRQIFFTDDDFFLMAKRSIQFCKDVINLKKKKELPDYLKFICLTNINAINKDNIQLIAEAGFRVLSVGVESVSQNKLNGMNKKQTVEKIWGVTKLILQNDIKPYYTLIIWTPETTIEDLIIDLEGFRRLSRLGVGLSVEPYLIPLPGTPYWEEQTPMDVRKVKSGDIDIIKGYAWIPKGKKELEIFRTFVSIYAKYRKCMFDTDIVKHKEKNWQANVILDALELTLKNFGYLSGMNDYNKNLWDKLCSMPEYDVDIVGDIKEKDSFNL